jgi:hypothetical protein
MCLFSSLAKLIKTLNNYQTEFDYFFLANNDPTTLKRQKGVFRCVLT